MELYHYGIPGMKWGIRRTPEQLRHDKDSRKKKNQNSAVVNAVKNNRIDLTISNQQLKHINDSKEYTIGRSYVYKNIDMQQLIKDLYGTGQPIPDDENWNSKERVSSSKFIGVYIEKGKKNGKKTKNLIIHYSKKGTHAVPARP